VILLISLLPPANSAIPACDMAPSATSEIVVPEVEVAKQVEKHVHGAEDKTPLEAISHGPVLQPGKISLFLFVSHEAFLLLYSWQDER
jgi:hypothetical protein